MEEFDAIIIGTGQAGAPLASFLSEKGWNIAVVEKSLVGGTCVNYGCTPTKTLIASARVAYLNKIANQYGIDHGSIDIHFSELQKRKKEVVSASRKSSEKRLKENENITFIEGRASFINRKEILVKSVAEERKITAQKIFINTGTKPAIPPFEGLDTVPFLDTNALLDIENIPTDLIILGGSYIALEFGQLFSRLGSRVTILEKSKFLVSREDEDISLEIEKILRNEGLKIHTEAEIISVEKCAQSDESAQSSKSSIKVNVKKDGKSLTITGSHLLLALGREPNTPDLDLENAGIEVDKKGFIKVNEFLETKIQGIYALGDVKGGPAFTHISYDDYRIVSHNLFNDHKKSIKGRVVPYCIFTDPELGRTGLTEKEAKKQGLLFRVAKMPMTSVARAIESGETRGFMKVLIENETDLILGAAILAVNGGEIASFLHLAILGKIPYTLIRDSPFSHPTLIESLNNLFFNFQD